MTDISFENKLVAVMNKSIEPGKIMNALAHMCIGFGAALGKDALRLSQYVDKDNSVHPDISEMPFIILRENSNKIRQLRQTAIENSVLFSDFTDTMTVGTYIEQLEKTKQTSEAELVYYGIVLFGPWDKITEMTKKFSLWK